MKIQTWLIINLVFKEEMIEIIKVKIKGTQIAIKVKVKVKIGIMILILIEEIRLIGRIKDKTSRIILI